MLQEGEGEIAILRRSIFIRIIIFDIGIRIDFQKR